jgi:hypothetical protein
MWLISRGKWGGRSGAELSGPALDGADSNHVTSRTAPLARVLFVRRQDAAAARWLAAAPRLIEEETSCSRLLSRAAKRPPAAKPWSLE